MKVYIAGPMRGYDCFNFPAFDACAADLRQFGYDVISPAEHDREQGFDETKNSLDGFDMTTALLWDLEQVANVDAIVLLPGWEKSTGVAAELATARALGKAAYTYEYSEYFEAGRMTLLPSDRTPSTDSGRTAIMNFGGEIVAEVATSGEVRVVDPETGGAKGSKLARFDLIPAGALWQLAEHYGRGAEKYDENNWRRGYAWSLSFAALQRHAWAFWNGEDVDEETGSPHMVAVAWHAVSLLTFLAEGLGTDDRQAVQK